MFDSQRVIDKMNEFEDLCESMKGGKVQFEARISDLRKNDNKLMQIKTQLTEKIN